MNMKKTFAGCLILIAVLTLVVVSAGCVEEKTQDNTSMDIPDVVKIIDVEKTGTTYSIGDTMEVTFIGALENSKLYVKDHADGISVKDEAVSAKLGGVEVSAVKFTITALKGGDHSFTIAIGNPDFNEHGLVDVLNKEVYKDTMHVVETGAEPMTPRGVFTMINLADHPTYPGEYYEIAIRGNATTGYHWVAAENPGLIVSEPVYIPDEAPEGMVGVGGTYHWYVTSDKPGEYEFTAYEMPPAGDEPAGRVIVPVPIAKKTN